MIVLPITHKVLRRLRFKPATLYFVFEVLLALASLSTTFLLSESSYGYPAWGVPLTFALSIISDAHAHIKLFLY